MAGTLSLSMELELGWGAIRDAPKHRLRRFSSPRRKEETSRFQDLLKVAEKYDVPFTFDIVGHLLMKRCRGVHEGPHPDGWFCPDPGTDARADPLWYAPDFVQELKRTDTEHEICTHTFSHVPTAEMSGEVLDWELRRARNLHKESNLEFSSTIVTPWHQSPPYTILRNQGIQRIRVPRDGFNSLSNPVEKFWWYLSRDPVEHSPRVVDGVIEIYTSSGPSLSALYLPQGRNRPHPAFRVIPLRIRQRIHLRYLRQAIRAAKQGADIHLWTHLYDICNGSQWPQIKTFLREASEAHRQKELQLVTMNEMEPKQVSSS